MMKTQTVQLTAEQIQWLETVTANGMTVAQAAVDWALRSRWASQCETLDSVVECLESDHQDGNMNRVSAKQAGLFLSVLKKMSETQRSERLARIREEEPARIAKVAADNAAREAKELAEMTIINAAIAAEANGESSVVVRTCKEDRGGYYATVDLGARFYRDGKSVARRYAQIDISSQDPRKGWVVAED